MRISHIILSIVLSTAVMSRAFSVTLELFDKKGNPIGNINKGRIHDGDILKFNDGNEYEVISYLGEGKVNIVFKVRMIPPTQGVPETLALRLPQISDKPLGPLPPQHYINSYIDGYDLLEKQGIPVPKKFKSLEGQYVASEFVKNDFNGHDFFTNPEMLAKKYSPSVLQEAEEALVDFARFTVRFKNIGDFGPSQLVYNIETKTWTLLDWFDAHQLVRFRLNRQKNHAFSTGFELDLVVTQLEDGTQGSRPLTPRERRIIARLGETVIAERKNLNFYRCYLNLLMNR